MQTAQQHLFSSSQAPVPLGFIRIHLLNYSRDVYSFSAFFCSFFFFPLASRSEYISPIGSPVQSKPETQIFLTIFLKQWVARYILSWHCLHSLVHLWKNIFELELYHAKSHPFLLWGLRREGEAQNPLLLFLPLLFPAPAHVPHTSKFYGPSSSPPVHIQKISNTPVEC